MLIKPWKHEVINMLDPFEFHDSAIMGQRRVDGNMYLSFNFVRINAKTALNPTEHYQSIERLMLVAGGIYDEWFFYEHGTVKGEKRRGPTPADYLKVGILNCLTHGITPGGNN